jgi:DNA polymerase
MARYLYIDFESRSRLALAGPTGVGAYAYAEHPSTSVLCLAWALDDEPVRLWRPQGGTTVIRGAAHDAGDREWENLIRQPDVVVVAHNIEFERSILREKFDITTPVSRWEDTAAHAARISLPRNLEEAGAALKLAIQKDTKGEKVMKKLCKPRVVTARNKPDTEFWELEQKPEDFERLYAYCMDDVASMRLLHKAVPPLSASERKIWELTLEANERGIKVDVEALAPAQALADKVEERLVREFLDLVGVLPNSAVKAAEALGLPDFTEDTVRRTLLSENLDPKKRRALEVRQLQAYSSVKKLSAFRDRTSRDGRLRGSLIYGGAERTTRWSSGGVQIQNLPSAQTAPPPKDMDLAFELLKRGCLDLVHEDVLGALAGMLRGFFVGPFLVGDLAQVEARNTAWLAKQYDLVDAFATGSDPYKQMACVIYGVEFDKVVKLQREVGKRAILGCGYGMGPDKFRDSLERQYGIKIDAALAERTVSAYRRKYARIPQLWRDVGEGFARAITGQHACIQGGPCEMGMTEIAGQPFAYIRLPSGRALFYGWPHVKDGEPRYFGRVGGKHWGTVGTWGGKLVENIVQALSRDLLADIMIRADDAGLPMSFTVHDEIVAESGPERLHEYEQLFKQKPAWAATLAVGAECFATRRYRK